VSEYPGFGVLLARLLDRRELDARSLSGAGSEKGELRAVPGGAVPSRSLFRWLAMRVPDLYLMAGMEVPAGLAPLDARAGPQAARLVWKAGELPERARATAGLRRSLPQQDRAKPFPPPREYERYPPQQKQPAVSAQYLSILPALRISAVITAPSTSREGALA
jgi:hypothetical protein